MKGLFADTYYYLALLNPRDSAHPEAVAIGPTLAGRLVTTQYVLTEVADALSAPQDRAKFLALLVLLESDPSVTIVPGSNDLFSSGSCPLPSTPRQGLAAHRLHQLHCDGRRGPHRSPDGGSPLLPGWVSNASRQFII
jgi:hypothetical protein